MYYVGLLCRPVDINFYYRHLFYHRHLSEGHRKPSTFTAVEQHVNMDKNKISSLTYEQIPSRAYSSGSTLIFYLSTPAEGIGH